MNLILIIVDSLRADHVGINGNTWIKTPNMDKLGSESARFTRAFPESLPTIPVRRAIHTGKRCFPFNNWKPYKQWPVPGWIPIPEADITMAEILQEKGYTTAFITDVYHMFKPGMNFHRGFDEWRWIRGQEYDGYRTGSFGKIDIEKYLTPDMDRDATAAKLLPKYLRSAELRRGEKDYLAPQVFGSATRWLEENYKKSEPFFLCVDSFDPHEPWDPPQHYVDLYDPGYKGIEVILAFYTNQLDYLTEEQLKHVRALYAGEVTMVDTWLGYFLEKVEQMGLMEDTVIAFISDHGHVIGEHRVLGKVPFCMYPEIMDLVLFIKAPGQSPKVVDSFVYDHDLLPTLFHLLGEEIPEQAEGKNLWDLVEGKTEKFHDYVTCMYKNWGWVRDDRYVYIARPDGSEAQLYDLKEDPEHNHNIAEKATDTAKRMLERLLADAGGKITDYDVSWRY
jgi:arylsulfatase A-like enzyme